MACLYDGFDIESFEAGRNLWHARIRRADAAPVVIDGVPFPALELGFAWSDPDAAIADAISHIDRFGPRYAATAPRTVMLQLVTTTPAHASTPRSHCPDCKGSLAVLRVIAGRARSEYWTMRCTACGGIHLDILQTSPISSERHAEAGPDKSPAVTG